MIAEHSPQLNLEFPWPDPVHSGPLHSLLLQAPAAVDQESNVVRTDCLTDMSYLSTQISVLSQHGDAAAYTCMPVKSLRCMQTLENNAIKTSKKIMQLTQNMDTKHGRPSTSHAHIIAADADRSCNASTCNAVQCKSRQSTSGCTDADSMQAKGAGSKGAGSIGAGPTGAGCMGVHAMGAGSRCAKGAGSRRANLCGDAPWIG